VRESGFRFGIGDAAFPNSGKQITVSSMNPGLAEEDPLRRLTAQVDNYSRQAEEMGRMLAGHRMLECPACGLAEDALADLTLRVVRTDEPDRDCGLRFDSADEGETTWICPDCGAIFTP